MFKTCNGNVEDIRDLQGNEVIVTTRLITTYAQLRLCCWFVTKASLETGALSTYCAALETYTAWSPSHAPYVDWIMTCWCYHESFTYSDYFINTLHHRQLHTTTKTLDARKPINIQSMHFVLVLANRLDIKDRITSEAVFSFRIRSGSFDRGYFRNSMASSILLKKYQQ